MLTATTATASSSTTSLISSPSGIRRLARALPFAGAGTAESCKNLKCSISTEEEDAVEVPKLGAQDKDGSCRETLEFQKSERAPPHWLASAMVVPFSRPAPSKWDDAQKWITGPASSRARSKAGGGTMKKNRLAGNGSGRGTTAKVILEVEKAGRQAEKEIGGVKGGNWAAEPNASVDSGMEPATTMENPATEIAGKKPLMMLSFFIVFDGSAFLNLPAIYSSSHMRRLKSNGVFNVVLSTRQSPGAIADRKSCKRYFTSNFLSAINFTKNSSSINWTPPNCTSCLP
ncbi:hypothetical protein BHM03_00061137 [Ensete ventricosum]|nr:hypothetical protein BHM03_00061137 [Ensete ventricosum]